MIKAIFCFTLLATSNRCSPPVTENQAIGITLPNANDPEYPNLPLPPLSKKF